MELDSLTFILLFMPISVLLAYFIKDNKVINFIILLLNIAFYLFGDYRYLILLFIISLITYLAAKKIKNNKVLYGISVLLIVGTLLFFKYNGLILNNLQLSLKGLLMPLGLSYYSFNAISYLSDVYRNKYEYCDDPLEIFTYLSFFPLITSGPLLRFDRFNNYYNCKDISTDNIAEGLRRFIVGLFKKVVLADQLSVLVGTAFNVNTKLSTPLAWVGLLGYALRLYLDFSGYDDMAIAVGNMLGFKDIPENFNEPYTSKSISEFWRRWHITLGAWFRDYIYIPLGGNRVNTFRWVINIMAVWLATGIWHGSRINFLIWGIYNGILVLIDRKLLSKIKMPTFISWFITMFMVIMGWLIFNTNSPAELLRYLSVLFGGGEAFSMTYIRMLDILYLWPIYLLSIIFVLPITEKSLNKLNDKYGTIYDILLLILGLLSLICILGGSQVTAIYIGF